MNVVNDNKIKATTEASMSSLVLGNLSWKIENDNHYQEQNWCKFCPFQAVKKLNTFATMVFVFWGRKDAIEEETVKIKVTKQAAQYCKLITPTTGF